jgi:hypothetical protein
LHLFSYVPFNPYQQEYYVIDSLHCLLLVVWAKGTGLQQTQTFPRLLCTVKNLDIKKAGTSPAFLQQS